MRQWFKYFRFWLLICGAVIIVCAIVAAGKKTSDERINNVCTESERVFDYADVLSDAEENSLRELIAEKEKVAKCDIVIVTCNQSLEEYAKAYDSTAYGSEYAMIFADNFYDEAGFGWNKLVEADDGDGTILVDNWYREADGKVYTWLSTSGKCQSVITTDKSDAILDEVYEYINSDPYTAYRAYVNGVAKRMTSSLIPGWLVVVLPLVVAVIFIIIKISGKEGKKTTNPGTYTNGVGGNFRIRDDRFIRKSVTQRTISDGDGGGGGGHMSAGGHSHGGSGHSR